MANSDLIGHWIRRFLMEYLVKERNLSRNTQTSYRDALKQLLLFIAEMESLQVDQLLICHFNADKVKLFLTHVETERRCSISTRNQRLAAVHALARFVGRHSPEHVAWCTEVCGISFKKAPKSSMFYLEKFEIDAILDMPDQETEQGLRDYAILLFLYNSGARADEVAQAKINDLHLGRSPMVRIAGKGNKARICPLWSLTNDVLDRLVQGRSSDERIFLNRRKQPMTRFGIHDLVRRYVAATALRIPSIAGKRISVHSIRHTTAVHLLRAGVDINTIRAWLGHVSLDTTNIYAEVDLEMKARALSHCEILSEVKDTRSWNKDPDLMAFLRSL